MTPRKDTRTGRPLTEDRQAAAIERLRAKGLGLAPHMVDGKVAPRRSSKSIADGGALGGRAAPQGRGEPITLGAPSDRSTGRTAPGTVFEFIIPAPADWLNENLRLNRYEKARRVKAWRQAAAMHARRQGLPAGLQRVRIDAYVIKPVANNSDPANWAPTSKAVTDGLIDAGLCQDDNRKHVEGPFMHDGGRGEPGLRIVVTVLENLLRAS